jgi:hypothetical protein
LEEFRRIEEIKDREKDSPIFIYMDKEINRDEYADWDKEVE